MKKISIFLLAIVYVLLAVNPSWSADEVKNQTHERINEILSKMPGNDEVDSPSRYLLRRGFSSKDIAKTLELFMVDVQAQLPEKERVEILPLDDIFDNELDTADVILHSAAFMEYLKKREVDLPSSCEGESLAVFQMQVQSLRESYVNQVFQHDCFAYDLLTSHVYQTLDKITETFGFDDGSSGATSLGEIEFPEIPAM